MENTEAGKAVSSAGSSDCVRVAVNIRPLITTELLLGCTDCITVVPGEPQVQIGSHVFTFDHVYGSVPSSSHGIYDDCVAPLVDALFHGYNATVLAYGQTGSGKTYTMGTNYNGEANSGGIIPKVVESIFSRAAETKENVEFLIRVSFIEIFKEEVFDLLEGASGAKPAASSRVPIQIRETTSGGITLAGVTEPEVRTKEEMASFLSRGSIARATGSTNMNSQSSRSHAIFTITMEQKKTTRCPGTAVINDDFGDDILCAKLHLVDLAGSERAKRTGADGLRLKEGIHINKGLLALGNVISALGDEKKRKEGGHVPYRDSKLTRLLQDSLGGNSRTVMIACVSPADTNVEETLNTLKYANRARNIQNKAIINRDPMAAQMQRMRSQIEQLQAELLCFRGEGSTSFEELQILKHKVSLLEASKAELHRELQERHITCKLLEQRALDAQVEKAKLLMKVEYARNGKPWDEIDSGDETQDVDLLKTYVAKIQELEGELLRLQSLNNPNRGTFIHCLDMEDDVFNSRNSSIASLNDFPSDSDDKTVKVSGGVDEIEKELEHSTLQSKLDMELQELNKCLEQKEAEMKRFATVDTSVLKHHYEKKVHELEQEKKSLMKEIEDLRFNLSNISSASGDGAQKLKEEYLQKLNFLEAQVADLKKKQNEQSQLLRQKQKSDESAKRLQEEIQRIKSQKVQLQQKIKQESEQFRLWKASREKEVLQLKKEGRRNEYEMHKLQALNQRQRMVLQRKTEEASMATKKLKELLEAKKPPARAGIMSSRGVQALMQDIEHELEVTTRVHEVRSEYERQMKERASMAKEVANLKEEAEAVRQRNMGDCSVAMSPGARNSRIFALENMLATSSNNIVLMASQLSEAEERERVFGGKGRWNQIPSLSEAKNMMNHLFNLASSSRCQLRDKEMDCREKDSTIKDLKDKVVELNTLVRHLKVEKEALLKEMMQRLAQKCSLGNKCESHVFSTEEGGHIYNLRKGPRSSSMFNMDALEDMDISESEQSDSGSQTGDEDWVESGKRHLRKRDLKPVQNVCCSCSKKSLCKTNKCECRAGGSTCGQSCGCVPTKCANRESGEIKMLQSPQEVSGSCMGAEDIEKNRDLASQGALLLQSAMAEKPVEMKHETGEKARKPLTDIGNNTLIKSNAARKDQRKKWGKRKSTIQLVPLPPQPSNQSTANPENNVTQQENVIPLKLPRAMRSTSSNNNANTLRERNSDCADDDIVGRQARDATADEKENRGRR